MLEERVDTDTDPTQQFLWGIRFVDDLVLRDKDTTGNGTLNERLYGLSDPRFSLVAITDSTGVVTERYAYDGYGRSDVFAPDFRSRAESSFGWEYRYTGRRLDLETAIYFFRARLYHAELGRFISRDPLGYIDGLNFYRAYFVPSGTDPSGYTCQKTHLVCCAFDTGNTIETLNASCDSEKNWAKCCQAEAKTEGWRFLGSGHGKECTHLKDCDTEDEARKVHTVAIQFGNALGGNPDRWRRIAELTKQLQKINSLRPKDTLKNKGEVAAIIKKIKELSEVLNKHNGLAIWVRVRGECCENGKFVSKSFVHKCSARGKNVEIGFNFDDDQGLAKAIPKCLKEAINAFKCSKAIDK